MVGADRIFSPYLLAKVGDYLGATFPLPIIVSIRSRIGTEKLQFGWLQLATVRPHPHWQVSPSAISWSPGPPRAPREPRHPRQRQ